MAGRSRVPAAHGLHLRDHPPPHLPLYARHPPPPHHLALIDDHPHHLRRPEPHPAIVALEDRLAAQTREIQALLIDNQRLAATHVALKQELTSAQHHLRLAAADVAKARDDREAEVRALYDRAAKAAAEARDVDGARAELEQVRRDVQKLRADREELLERLRGVQQDLERARSEIAHGPEIRGEIEAMHREIQRGRAAVEYEKKAHASNMEQSQAMEANMVLLAREVEKLRAELANAEKRGQTSAAAIAAATAANPGSGYNAGSYGNSEITYGGPPYGDAYSMQQAQGVPDGGLQYGTRGADNGSHYGSRGADVGPQYGSRTGDGVSQYATGSVSHGPYDVQQTHAHR